MPPEQNLSGMVDHRTTEDMRANWTDKANITAVITTHPVYWPLQALNEDYSSLEAYSSAFSNSEIRP